MKHLSLLGLFLTILSAESAFLLPHRWQDARHEVNMLIRRAETPVVIITDALDDVHLRRSLRRVLKDEHSVTLMTASQETAAQWAAYKSLDACVLSSDEPLTFTLVSSGKRACALNAPLQTQFLRSRTGVMYCTDAETFEETVRLLKQECRDYFGMKR
jgi:hypothetical protein